MEEILLYARDFRTEKTDCLQKEVVSNQPTNISFKIILAGILSDTIPSETEVTQRINFHRFHVIQNKIKEG